MKGLHSIAMLAALLVTGSGSVAWAQAPCPPEVAEAEKLLASIKTAARPSRSAAAARDKDVQAPRTQDRPEPRSQDVQAPRGQDIQAPKGQDVQAPRGQDIQAPRGYRTAIRARNSTIDSATRLVRDARRACETSDMPRAGANARAALELLNYLK